MPDEHPPANKPAPPASSEAPVPPPLLILHAGPHKTGTTALQLRLLSSREHLRRHGYDYPALGLSQFGHHHINAFLRGDHANAGQVTEQAIQALAAERQSIILSSEDLIYQPVENLERLRALFPGFRVEVILFIRTPVELWPSHWQELVKHGRDESLLEYVGAYFGLNTVFNARDMHPVAQAGRFSQAFGRRSVRMFCYNNILADGVDLFDFFCEKILDLPPVLPRLPTLAMNASLPAETNELLRCLNERYRRGAKRSPRSAIAAAYLARADTFQAEPEHAAFCAAFARAARAIILDSESDLLRARDRQVLRRLGERIENSAGPEQLFARPCRREIRFGTPFWADHMGLGPYLDQLLHRLGLN